MSKCKSCRNKCNICGKPLRRNSLVIDSPIVTTGILIKRQKKICETCRKKVDKKKKKD